MGVERSLEGGRALYPLSVLVVDDNATSRLVLRHILGAANCVISEAVGGGEALHCAAIEFFDLILLDIHMPGLNGFDVVKALRAGTGMNRSTRVVAVTAEPNYTLAQYQRAGFDDFIPKPVCVERVLTQVALAGLEVTGAKSPLSTLGKAARA